MSLEALIAAHTEALNANTAALKAHTDFLAGLKANKQTAVTAPAADAGKGDEKSAPTKGDETETKTRRRSSSADKETKPVKESVPTVTEMKEMAEKYLDVAEEGEYQERRKNFRAIVEHFDAPKFTEIAKEDRLLASKLLKMASSGENFDRDDIPAMVAEITGVAPAETGRSRRDNDDV